ncbi:hypothetical protein A0257_19325 [Hymenobacter psoromatis]|nr:hypothetical protein A0257_19325 [Hymenobacter psoromatis]
MMKPAKTAAVRSAYFYQKPGPMKNAITTLRIQNFKSIKEVTMTPRRVNIIIGEPNVGKSNILEAISLLGGMFFDDLEGQFMKGQIRYEVIRNLFYDNDWSQEITVIGEGVGATRMRKAGEQIQVVFGNGEMRRLPRRGKEGEMNEVMEGVFAAITSEEVKRQEGINHSLVSFEYCNHWKSFVTNDGGLNLKEWSHPKMVVSVKKYTFQKYITHGNAYDESYLRPPFGSNLMEVIQSSPSAFRKEVASFFTKFGLNLALRIEQRELEIQKNLDGFVYNYPYSLTADTLQRLIFYLAAIESNDDAVLLFEEPEAHSYPTYVAQLGQHIVESRNNQFFIVTHSPYLVTEILEEMLTDDELKPELAIFAAYYENYQTKVNQLSDEEIMAVRADGLDVFFNMRRFVPEAGGE